MVQTFFVLLSMIFLGNHSFAEETQIEVISLERLSWVSPTQLTLTLNAIERHKVYSESIKLRSQFGSEVTFKNIKVSPLETFKDKFSGDIKTGVKGQFQLTAEVYSSREIKDEKYPLILDYQACSEEYCLFPQEYHFTVPMFIQDSSMSLARMMSESIILAMIFVFFAGFLTSFTPCIFPMIPLTLAVLTPKGQQLNFSTKLFRSLSYVFGIALTYSVFGVLAASTGHLFGSFLGNQWVAIGIGLFFVSFAISMLGFFEIKTPTALSNLQFSRGASTFFFGLAAGVIAGPCVGPVLLSILAYISQSGNLMTGFLLMMSFAFGMGLIFIVLGVAGDLFKILPRSGNWLNSVKYVFAIAMLGLAFYYVHPVLSPSQFIAFVASAFLVVAFCYLVFYEKKFFVPLAAQVKWTLKGIVTVLLLAAVTSLIFSKKIDQKMTQAEDSSGWVIMQEEEFSNALKNGKPTVVDLYADWCASCKELKGITFKDSEVVRAGGAFNRVVIDATSTSTFVESFKKTHGVLGLPTILFFDEHGQVIKNLTLTGFESPPEFLVRMNRALKEKKEQQ